MFSFLDLAFAEGRLESSIELPYVPALLHIADEVRLCVLMLMSICAALLGHLLISYLEFLVLLQELSPLVGCLRYGEKVLQE